MVILFRPMCRCFVDIRIKVKQFLCAALSGYRHISGTADFMRSLPRSMQTSDWMLLAVCVGRSRPVRLIRCIGRFASLYPSACNMSTYNMNNCRTIQHFISEDGSFFMRNGQPSPKLSIDLQGFLVYTEDKRADRQR